MRLFCLQLEASFLQWSFFTYSSSFLAYSFSYFTYNWSFFSHSGKVRLIRALRDCEQRSSTVSKKAPTVSKKAPPPQKKNTFPRKKETQGAAKGGTQKGIGHHFFCFSHLLVTMLSLFWRFWSLFCLSPFASPIFAAGRETVMVTVIKIRNSAPRIKNKTAMNLALMAKNRLRLIKSDRNNSLGASNWQVILVRNSCVFPG